MFYFITKEITTSFNVNIDEMTYMGVLVLVSAQEEKDLHTRIFSHLDSPGFTEQKTNQTSWSFTYDKVEAFR